MAMYKFLYVAFDNIAINLFRDNHHINWKRVKYGYFKYEISADSSPRCGILIVSEEVYT